MGLRLRLMPERVVWKGGGGGLEVRKQPIRLTHLTIELDRAVRNYHSMRKEIPLAPS